MPSVTDPSPFRRLSRYRSIRGKNVPESRRLAEPIPSNSVDNIATSIAAGANTDQNTGANGVSNNTISAGVAVNGTHRRTRSVPLDAEFADEDAPPPVPTLPSGMQNGSRIAPAPAPAPAENERRAVSSRRVRSGSRSGAALTDSAAAAATTGASTDAQRIEARAVSQPQQRSAASNASPVPPLPQSRGGGRTVSADAATSQNGNSTTAAGKSSRRAAEVEQLLAEQKRKDLERLQQQLANHQPVPLSKSPVHTSRFAFWRRHANATPSPSTTPKPQQLSAYSQPAPVATSSTPATTSTAGPPPRTATTSTTATTTSSRTAVTSGTAATTVNSVSASTRPTTSHGASTKSPGPNSRLDAAPAPAPTVISEPKPMPHLAGAPSSAPDGSTRHVTLRFRQQAANVTVHHNTTVNEILQICPEIFSPNPIEPATCALLECYVRLGLERRLRRYERIRDIMNSWDSDTANYLVVVTADSVADSVAAATAATVASREKERRFHKHSRPSGSNVAADIGRCGNGADLDVSAVPRTKTTPPGGLSFSHVYHSNKPGSWTKRYISVVGGSGRVVASKRPDNNALTSLTKAEGKIDDGAGGSSSNFFTNHSDFESLCHLSDYDIYTPTETQLRKALRPPRRFCFAIKSQQRTTVFLNTEKFVHFFCTDHIELARAFYDRVFAWRSWYLVNKKLALHSRNNSSNSPRKGQMPLKPLIPMIQEPSGFQPPAPPPSSGVLRSQGIQRTASRRSTSNRVAADRNSVSSDSSLGDNMFADMDKPKTAPPQPIQPSIRSAKQSRPRTAAPAAAAAASHQRTQPKPLIDINANEAFDSNGLLGNSYEDRKRAEAVRQRDVSDHRSSLVMTRDGAFTDRPTLLNGGMGTTSSPLNGPSVSRSRSQRRPRDAEQLEAQSWFPSASEHSARQRTPHEWESSSSRPSSSSGPTAVFPQGAMAHHHRDVSSSLERNRSVRREVPLERNRSVRRNNNTNANGGPPVSLTMPQPLIDLTPKFQEAPQWSKEGRGHGVRVAPGTTHLVDLATDRGTGHNRFNSNGNNYENVPSRNAIFRRDEIPGGAPMRRPTTSSSGRSVTMTSASAANAASFARSNSQRYNHGYHSSRAGDLETMPSRFPSSATRERYS